MIAFDRVPIAGNTQQYQEFMFLKGESKSFSCARFFRQDTGVDTIPLPISISEALERRADHEKEILDTQPALMTGGDIESLAQESAPPLLSHSISTSKLKSKRSTARSRNSDTKYRDRKAAGPSTATRIGPVRSTRGVKLARDWAEDEDDDDMDIMYSAPGMNDSTSLSTSRSRGAPLAPETLDWEDGLQGDSEAGSHANGLGKVVYPENDEGNDTSMEQPFQPRDENVARTIYNSH